LFARLGVFAAGFSLEAAETVCAHDAVPAVLDGIASLVDKSLLRTEDPLHGQPRFTMLQVVRDFALEQLEALGERERLRRAHADYYQGVIIAAEPMLRRDPGPVIEQYRADLPNIRAALRWSLEVKEGGRVARMAVAMWPFLWIAGLLSESVEVVQQALDDETALSAAERAHAHLGLGMLAFGQGNYQRAAPALETAIALYTQLGDLRHVATAQVPLGVIQAVWDPNGGEDLLTQAADTFRELDDQWGLAFASLNLGGALLLHHRYADAIPHLEESLQHARVVKADVFLSNALINLGWVHHWLGDVEAARARLREAVKHAAVTYAADWHADDFVEHQVFPGTTPDKKGAIDSYRIFFAASPDMTAEIHDMVAAGDKVAIRATYRGTDKGGFIPGMPATGKTFAMEAMYMVRINNEGQIAEHWGVVDTIGIIGQLGLLQP
jgi:predicted ester cyclase